MQPDDETNARHIALAHRQGDAFGAAVHEMTHREAHGREVRAGDYRVGIAVAHAEGLYQRRGETLEWVEPEDENAHIEVEVRDAEDGRFVPQLAVTVTVIDRVGRNIGRHAHPFLWHPWLYHYGRNWHLPGAGLYTIQVHIAAPDFCRHDRHRGRRFMSAVDVAFADVKIETGQKRS